MASDDKTPARFTGRHMLIVMVAFFGVVITANLTMAFFATHSWSGLEVPNSYVASQEYNDKIADARAQAALGWTSDLSLADGALVLELADADGNPIAGAEVEGVMRRLVHENDDTETRFAWSQGGAYRAPAPALAGAWEVEITARAGTDRLYRQIFRIEVKG
ncbi:MAG: hypothetical protein HKN60_07300 [Rhizobiales bacterium]|nr:hypothetical protein [Hyphomicrobiales bacterium]